MAVDDKRHISQVVERELLAICHQSLQKGVEIGLYFIGWCIAYWHRLSQSTHQKSGQYKQRKTMESSHFETSVDEIRLE